MAKANISQSASEWSPFVSSGGKLSDLLPFDGLTWGIVKETLQGRSDANNETLTFVIANQEIQGKTTRRSQAVSGTDTKGKGRQNIEGLLPVLFGVYTAEGDSVEDATAKIRAMTEIDSDEVAAYVVNKKVAYKTGAKVLPAKNNYKEAWFSDLQDCVAWQAYEAAVADGKNRSQLAPAAQAAYKARYGVEPDMNEGLPSEVAEAEPAPPPSPVKPAPKPAPAPVGKKGLGRGGL